MAYIAAVAAKAGVRMQPTTIDDYGVDGTFQRIKIASGKAYPSGFTLDFQAKASTNCRYETGHIVHELKAEAYNKIVRRNNEGALPMVLILMYLPSDKETWMESNEEQLLLRKCCYWERLTGRLTPNRESIVIRVPRSQQLTPLALVELLKRVKSGVWR
jgi:hypothetical protein